MQSQQRKRWNLSHAAVVVVLLIGLLVRFHGLVWTLPYFFYGDETRLVYNGITIQQFGVQSYTTNITSMSNYPPFRGWEIALTRTLLLLVFDDASVTNSVSVMYGRMFSLFYALITIAALYQLGRRVTGRQSVGILSALFFAVWSETIIFGQRTLSDGAGMMFFVLCALLAVMAYQKLSYELLVASVAAGIFAGLGKYNYFPSLLFPVLAGFYFLIKRPRQMLVRVVLPSLLFLLPVLAITARTISKDDLYYNYLNETAQLESEVRRAMLLGEDPESPEVRALYYRYPLNVLTRFETNYHIFLDFLPEFAPGLMLLGLLSIPFIRERGYDYPALAALAISSLLILLFFSRFRLLEGRQMFSSMLLLIVFWAMGIMTLARFSRVAAVIVAVAVILPMGLDSWVQNNENSKPDTRVETVKWFIDHVRDGTGIAIENEPYEFWEQNGYHEAKQFNVVRAYRLYENDPKTWENEGFYYLVADQTYEWRGGYYAGHALKALWDAEVEEVARFEGDAYSGPDRIIFRAFRPQVITNTSMGDSIIFYGYDVDSQTLHPGDTLHVKYYWQARKGMNTDYVVFNHLLDPGSDDPLIQFDRPAGQNGIHPASQWTQFEWVFDTFDLTIPDDTAPGTYSFQIGLYNPVDGTRLPVENGQNGILELFQVTVEEDGGR